MDPSIALSGVASIIQFFEYADRILRELMNHDATTTELTQSLKSLGDKVGDLSICLCYSDVEKLERKEPIEDMQRESSDELLLDLVHQSQKTVQELYDWVYLLKQGKGTRTRYGLALEWQRKLRDLRKQWERLVEPPELTIPMSRCGLYLQKKMEANYGLAKVFYENLYSGSFGEGRQESVAIVGMARKPLEQISSPNALWQMLSEKQSASLGSSMHRGPAISFLEEDPSQSNIFGTTPREASQMVPQKCLHLKKPNEAHEDAIYARNRDPPVPYNLRAPYTSTIGDAFASNYRYNRKRYEEALEGGWNRRFLPLDQVEKQPILSGITLGTRQEPISSAYHVIFGTASALTSTVCAICIRNYGRLHPRGQLSSIPRKTTKSPFTRTSSVILSPTPPIFVAATLTHGIATLSYYHSRPGDLYREWFLTAGLIGGTTIGFLAGKDIQGILLELLPFVLIMSLVSCTGLNAFLYCYGYRRKR